MKKTALHEAVLSLGQDAEYMSNDMIDIYRSYLTSEVPALKERIKTLEVTFRDRNSEKCSDPVDEAQKQTEQNNTLFEIKKCKLRINKINKALHNIKLGDYGFCIDCGEEIGVGRMCTDATNLRDSVCATNHERKQMQLMGGSPSLLLR